MPYILSIPIKFYYILLLHLRFRCGESVTPYLQNHGVWIMLPKLIVPFFTPYVGPILNYTVGALATVAGSALGLVANTAGVLVSAVGGIATAAVGLVSNVAAAAVGITFNTLHLLVDTVFHPFAPPLYDVAHPGHAPAPPPGNHHDTPPANTLPETTTPETTTPAVEVQHGTDGNDTYYYNIGDGLLQIADTTGDSDTLVINGLGSPLSLIGKIHIEGQDDGFIVTLGNDKIDATGIETIHIDALSTLVGKADFTVEELIGLGAALDGLAAG
jgi:hypothetical protein